MKYEKGFKEDALRLSDEIGVKRAADQLDLSYSTLSTWRARAKRYGDGAFIGSGHTRTTTMNKKGRRILELKKHLREVERADDILKEALGFFASSRKK